ncbi:MAG: 50S ribosomal protein L35ae [Candidatus Pacearchaeota archaeon]
MEVEAIIANFRRGRHTYTPRQFLLVVDMPREKAKALIGKEVIYECEGKKRKKIKGIIKRLHGNKSTLLAHFERGLPGQALGSKVKIIG